MAGKKKKKEKKKSSDSWSHIASHLVPSAIFAAAPRSVSPLSSTWPRSQSKSPISQAVGAAGTVGWAFFGGDINRAGSTGDIQSETCPSVDRPPANVPSGSDQVPQPADSDSDYEAVEVGENYDKTTRFAREAAANNGGDGNPMYHVLDDENQVIAEPVYAKVDKSKKKSSRQAREQGVSRAMSSRQAREQGMHEYEDVCEDVSTILSSDDELTDVTSNDEESSSAAPAKKYTKNSLKGRKMDPKLHKVRRDESTSEEHGTDKKSALLENHDAEDKEHELDDKHEGEDTRSRLGSDGSTKKKSTKKSIYLSKKRNSIDTVDGDDVSSGHQTNPDVIIDGKTSPTDSPYSTSSFKRGSKKSSLKRRSQVAPEEELELSGNDSSDKEGRQLERLGFEGTSQKVGLSDISEDEEGYSLKDLKMYPQSKVTDQRSPLNEMVVVNEEIQMTENENETLSVPYPHSLFEESPEQPLEKSENLDKYTEVQSASFFTEQQKQLEHLIRQQESVYIQQAEQQKEQQKQAEKLAQQQLELQRHLQHLEEVQNERFHSPPNNLSSQDVKLQRDMIEQQENFLRLQQQQQAKYESQQDRVLKQQEKIYDQIRELELQQKELQSNLSLLSPKESDLAEICWQEKEIIRLLNEQQSHQQKYDKLHKLQQQQLEQQANKFHQERQALENQQDTLQTKIKEQEEKSKKLEIELHSMSHPKKTRQYSTDSDGDMITSTQADEVDAVPVSRSEPPNHGSHRSNKKSKSTTKRSLNHIDVLTLENLRLSELNVSLQKENKVLKQFSETLEKGSGGTSLITQQYIKDLQQETKVLQDTVHRLNVELSRYQMKYRQASVEEVDSLLFPKKSSTELYPWLVNTKFLAPLFVAYDDRLKERDDIIRIYDEEMNSFKGRLMEIVKENQDLHMRLAKSKPDALDSDEWQQLQEHAKLVVEENKILMKQQDLQQTKMKEMQLMHGQDVSKLSMRITNLESQKNSLVTELEDCRCNHTALLQKYDQLLAEEKRKILIEEHLAMMDEFRSLMEDMKEKNQLEMEEMESKLEAINNEKQNLASNLTDSKAHISQLTKELDVYRKTQRKLERKSLLLEKKLEHILEREVNAQQTLSEVLLIAEKTAEERDSFEEFARTQEMRRKKSKSLLHQGDLSILGLQEKLKSNKKKSIEKVALIKDKLDEKEKQVSKIKEDHVKEVNKLRELVRDKQKCMEEMMGERRMFDQQLDEVWRRADQDNQLMRKTVEASHVRSTEHAVL